MTNNLNPPGLCLYRRRPSRIYCQRPRQGLGGWGRQKRETSRGQREGEEKINQRGAKEQPERPRTGRQTARHLHTERQRAGAPPPTRTPGRRAAAGGASRLSRLPSRWAAGPHPAPAATAAPAVNERRRSPPIYARALPGAEPCGAAAAPRTSPERRCPAALPAPQPYPPLCARVCGERAFGSNALEKR